MDEPAMYVCTVPADGEPQKDRNSSPDSIDHVAAKPARVLSLTRFVVLSFFLTCGGPFGLEEAIGAGGVAYCLVGLALLPFVWAIPQSLMTAELSTMMPENGGSYLWVWRALGDFAGFVNAYLSLFTSLFDMCLYPNLIAAYLPESSGFLLRYAVKVSILAAVSVCNIFGLELVGNVSIVLLCLSMSVFLAEIPFAIHEFSPVGWAKVPENRDWGLMASVLLWSNTGWDALGSVAGEVSDPAGTYPLGIALALIASTCAYVGPIIINYALLPDPARWRADAFYDAALRVSPWVALWMRAACALCNIGQLNAGIASTSRRLWAMAVPADRIGISARTMPKFMSTLSRGHGTPRNAILVQLLVTSIIVIGDFSELVQIEMLLNCCCLLLEFSAFMVLKYTEPLAPRPYVVPYGVAGAWTITLIKTGVVMVIIASSVAKSPFKLVATLITVFLVAILFKVLKYFNLLEPRLTPEDEDNSSQPLI